MRRTREALAALIKDGNPVVKERYKNGHDEHQSIFRRLLEHFDFFCEAYPESHGSLFRYTNRGFIANAKCDDLQPKSDNFFDKCFIYVQQERLNKLREYFKKNIDSYPPSKDHTPGSRMFKIAENYCKGNLSDDLRAPGFHFYFDFSSIQCHTITFEQILMIRNEIWHQSWWHSNFQQAPTTHFDEKTDAMDGERKRRWTVQIEFMQNYWALLQMRFVPPSKWASYPLDLQKAVAEVKYYKSLQSKGRVFFAGTDVTALSFAEVADRIEFSAEIPHGSSELSSSCSSRTTSP